jgi:uncharacterized membrane protein YdbT with pleckstrin-like domain
MRDIWANLTPEQREREVEIQAEAASEHERASQVIEVQRNRIEELESRAEKAERERDEAMADTERLDWLESKRRTNDWPKVELEFDGDEFIGITFSHSGSRTIRKAVDAARESGGEGSG